LRRAAKRIKKLAVRAYACGCSQTDSQLVVVVPCETTHDGVAVAVRRQRGGGGTAQLH
jgi:hypothetical protein